MKLVQNLMVGILFFGALSIVGYFTILSDSGPFAQSGRQMVLFFDNADGVKPGSKVTVLGVPNGTVKNVALVSVNVDNKPIPEKSPDVVGQRVAITVEIRKEIVFYSNYTIAIKSESLLSDKLIAIDPGTAIDKKDKKPLEKVKTFSIDAGKLKEEGRTALDMALGRGGPPSPQMAAASSLQGETSGDPIAGLSELIEENRENVRKTIDNIANITHKINRGDGTIGQLVNNDELHRNANTLVKDANVVIKELRETLEDTREQAPVTSFIRAALTAF